MAGLPNTSGYTWPSCGVNKRESGNLYIKSFCLADLNGVCVCACVSLALAFTLGDGPGNLGSQVTTQQYEGRHGHITLFFKYCPHKASVLDTLVFICCIKIVFPEAPHVSVTALSFHHGMGLWSDWGVERQ